MLAKQEEALYINELNVNRGSSIVNALRNLLEIYLSQAREDNDVAKGDEFLVNQGKIEAYKKLIGNIERGVLSPGEKSTITTTNRQ